MKIAIIGAGGFGREVHALIRAVNEKDPLFDVVGFVDDGLKNGSVVHGIPVLGPIAALDVLDIDGVVVAVGNPAVRQAIVDQVPQRLAFPNIIHPSVLMMDTDRISIGKGNIICAGNIFTTDIQIGDHCIINLSCTVGHDAVLGDFASVMPGVSISGGAQLEEGVYVGTGAKLIKATTLGQGCVIGAGAVVDTNIPPHTTAVGIPAKPLKKANE